MEVLHEDETGLVAGGLGSLSTIISLMALNLETLTASVTGLVDGFLDGLNGKTYDNNANPAF